MKKIAIFASGTGSNARKIIEYFKENQDISVELIISNRSSAPVLDLATEHQTHRIVLSRAIFYESQDILKQLKHHEIDLIVLAGFMWLMPAYLVHAYEGKIINIHPALLPKYGGKGMYGMHVHQAVKLANEKESGITIHYVNERYDEGDIIFQASCELSPEDSAEKIASKVLLLEHYHFARVIERLLENK
ncbi:MAG: phosphoribosylglycinamide formyltransferase [Saprospiraceae bacterium]|nr:MAG: phosphoribosylglycinamide formyltransferase [Saprospiraceae bacterium]